MHAHIFNLLNQRRKIKTHLDNLHRTDRIDHNVENNKHTTNMNSQLQAVTLQTAVIMQVKEFANSNRQFSVHDITQAIRNKVNQGVLEIPEVEVVGTSWRFDIPHTKVKGLFDELWRTGVFDPDFSLSRAFTGMYYEYTPSVVNSPAVAQPTFSVSQPMVVPPSTQSSTVSNADVAVKFRIETYLSNCKSKNFQPTLKQVQSAIKRERSTGWSCEQIQSYVEELDYNVSVNPDYLSSSQVIL